MIRSAWPDATCPAQGKFSIVCSMVDMPEWKIPENFLDLVEAGGGFWEDDQWLPILLTVMVGTSYNGRDIPVAWQIEFQPDSKVFEATNAKLKAQGSEPDGYAWASLIQDVFEKNRPGLLEELHFGDTEDFTCIVWVESEETCRQLMEVAWNLIHS